MPLLHAFDVIISFSYICLQQSGAKADFNKERGYLALVKGSVTLVYYAPVVLLPNNKTVTLPLDWDAQATTLSIVLPDLTFPVIIAFGLGTKIPDGKHKFGFSFPSLKFGSSGDVESDDDEDDEQTRKYSKPAPKVPFNYTPYNNYTRIILIIDLLTPQ